VRDEPPDLWSDLFEADNLASRVEVIRNLVKAASTGDTAAVVMLLSLLKAVDRLLADVQKALGERH
jgi:hypothetical protein